MSPRVSAPKSMSVPGSILVAAIRSLFLRPGSSSGAQERMTAGSSVYSMPLNSG